MREENKQGFEAIYGKIFEMDRRLDRHENEIKFIKTKINMEKRDMEERMNTLDGKIAVSEQRREIQECRVERAEEKVREMEAVDMRRVKEEIRENARN
ncbi:hypothetical protein QE152_g15683 [Popillia japonica]|uniref:Uncharacterized protein n=1 Tax=Popillia japonica TaxID=7064 RepID=A0AAW1L6E9_POPJA